MAVTTLSRTDTITLGDDLEVRRMGFGAMRLTGEGIWGEPPDPVGARDVLRRAVEMGIDFIDTADSYGPAVSERLIAEALAPYPEGLVIATKGGTTRPGPGEWERDGRPEHLRDVLEGSLRRLHLERIDLYQLHAVDPDVPYAESVGALADLQREGKIRHVGVSNVGPDELKIARREVKVVSVQNRYNLGDRSAEPVLDICEKEGIAFIAWFPLGAGELTREEGPLARIAERHDATSAQVALAWLLARSPVMLPIPGTSNLDHLEENVAAAHLELKDDELRELDRASVAGGPPTG